MIKTISKEEMRHKEGKEGLILQGCGGEPKEWLEGINELFTKEGILRNGTKFTECSVFQDGDLTCILFPFENVELDIGKLAIWRIKTHGTFGGTWLSDYVPNRLGGFEKPKTKQKPDCALIGEDGNIYNLMGKASKTLRRNGQKEEAEEMCSRIINSESYEAALNIIGEYVNITEVEGYTEETEDNGIEME